MFHDYTIGYIQGKSRICLYQNTSLIFFCRQSAKYFSGCRVMSAVKTSGVLRERVFNAAYKAKKQAISNGTTLNEILMFILLNFA